MKNLTEGNISKNFLYFAIPLILSGLLSQAYSTINTMVVGKIIGETGLAYIGSTATFVQIISSIIWGFGSGISLYIALLLGAKELNKMVNSIKVNLIIIACFAFLISVVVILFHRPIFDFLEIGEDIYHGSFSYYAIYLSGFPVLSLNWSSLFIFNAIGCTTFPLKMSVLSTVGNILISIVLIVFADMGANGAAVATVIVSLIVFICYVFKFRSEFSKIGITKQKLDFNFTEILKAWKLGIPCMVQQMILYSSSVGVQPVINSLGNAAIAGYSVCMRIYDLNAVIFQNSSKCLSNYCAQCIGSGKISYVKKGFVIGFSQSLFLAIPMMILCFFLPEKITMLFYNDIESQSAMYVMRYILVCVPFIVFQIINNLFHNFYRGVMMPNVAAVTTFCYTVTRIVGTFMLSGKYKMNGVFYALAIAWVVEAFISAVIFISNKWKNSEYKKLELLEKS